MIFQFLCLISASIISYEFFEYTLLKEAGPRVVDSCLQVINVYYVFDSNLLDFLYVEFFFTFPSFCISLLRINRKKS